QGWYTSADCTTAFDFTKSPADQGMAEPYTLYGKYLASAGPLPTVEFPDNGGPAGDPALAGWSLAADGTLKITCAEGQTIADFGWEEDAAAKGTAYQSEY